MARLRVFVSSTYYDLKHVRSSLQLMIEGLGHEPVLFEHGNVMFDPSKPLDSSCYREMDTADIAVLIIGGRYGSEVSGSGQGRKELEEKLRKFDSITRREHETALDNGIPIYTFIDKSVRAEYITYLRNKDNASVSYAHVDSINIFDFIESIEMLGSNNVIHVFEKATDIEVWLKEQWSGLFRELLRSRKENLEVRSLSAEVERLREAGKTLEKYLEEVLRTVEPRKAESIIHDEGKRREDHMMQVLQNDRGLKYINSITKITSKDLIFLISSSSSMEDLLDRIEAHGSFSPSGSYSRERFFLAPGFRWTFDAVREAFGLSAFPNS